MRIETIRFANGAMSKVVRVSRETDPAAIIAALGISTPRAIVCLNGGTAKLKKSLSSHLESLLADGVARIAAEESLAIITGATDAGIISLLGRGVEKWRLNAPLIGVAPDKLVTWPGRKEGDTPLEPHHSHFVLVEGEDWGDETKTMYALAGELSESCPSLAVYAGGGNVAGNEMQANVNQGRQMILIDGSGRKTDAVLAARRGGALDDESVQQIAAKGRIVPFDIHAEPQALAGLIRNLLFGAPASLAKA